MTTKHDCQCPPFPYFSPGSLASGSNAEREAHRRWEAEHGGHPNAAFARLEPVRIDQLQLATYTNELRLHLEYRGPTAVMAIAPHHLKALLDAAALADAIPEKTQAHMDKALAALRTVPTSDGEFSSRAVMSARDFLREAGARNIPVPPDQEVTEPNATPLPPERPETTLAELHDCDLALEPGFSNLRG